MRLVPDVLTEVEAGGQGAAGRSSSSQEDKTFCLCPTLVSLKCPLLAEPSRAVRPKSL